MLGRVTLGRAWIGNLRGTWVANLFAEVSESEGAPVLTLKVGAGAPAGGAMTFVGAFSGALSEGSLLRLASVGNPALQFTLVVNGTTDVQVFGRWDMSDGNSGVFDLTVSDRGPKTQGGEATPIYVTNKSMPLPRVTLYRDEVKEIIDTMKHLLPSTYDVWIKAGDGGREELTAFEKAFWQKPNLPKVVTQLTISLSEPPSPVARVLTVSLTSDNSFYSASGMDEVWVSGAIQRMGDAFESKRRWWRTLYEVYGLNFNSLAAIIAFIAAPSLQLIPRAIFTIITLLLMVVFYFLHRATTKMRIHLKRDYKPSPLIELPRLVTGLVGSLLVPVIAFLAAQFTDARLAGWLDWLIVLLRDGS